MIAPWPSAERELTSWLLPVLFCFMSRFCCFLLHLVFGPGCVNQIESNIGLRCRPRNPNSIKRIMSETRFTKFPALSVDPRIGISRSASKTNVSLFVLPMTLKIIIYQL